MICRLTILISLLASSSVSARLRGGVKGTRKTSFRFLKDKGEKGEKDGGIVDPDRQDGSDCSDIDVPEPKQGLDTLEIFDIDPNSVVPDNGDQFDPCGRSIECLTLTEVTALYPGILDFDSTECTSPDDCTGECRVHFSGLVCDESDGPFPQLSPLCDDTVVIIPTFPPQTAAPTPEDTVEQTPEQTAEQTPEQTAVQTPQDTPADVENDKVKFLGTDPRFRHRIPSVTSFSSQP
mmetsp:Transcript_769/g.1370  ORF Transcript_769/g.1370 Transcript_769/m.1370 type:complete len:235 (+) Transcript_769:3608-4312(+)